MRYSKQKKKEALINLNKHEIVATSIQDIKNVCNISNARPNIAEKGRGSFYAFNSQCKAM